MKDAQRYQLRLLAEVIAFKLYKAHLDDDVRDRHAATDIQKMFLQPVSRRFIESCLGYLRSKHQPALIIRSGAAGNYTYRISGEGILFVEKMLRDKESLISYFAANGDSSLDAVASFEALFHIEDDEQGSMTADWRPFEIKRASNEYKNFHKSLEEAIRKSRKATNSDQNFPMRDRRY